MLNLTDILESIQENYSCLCDFKDHTWIWKKNIFKQDASAYTDTRFFVFSQQFYLDYIQSLHQQHHQGCFYIETQFYRAIKALKEQEKVISRFPIEPKFFGIAGHFQGKNYNSPKENLKFFIRSLNRELFPWLHL